MLGSFCYLGVRNARFPSVLEPIPSSEPELQGVGRMGIVHGGQRAEGN